MRPRLLAPLALTLDQTRSVAALYALKLSLRRGATAALLSLLTWLAGADAARAAVYTKNATPGDLSVGTSWANGTVPGGADIALFNNTITAAQVDTITAAALTLGELQIVNPGGLITINGPLGLTLNGVNGVGIDMSAATQNLTIGAPLSLGGSQVWNVATGRTLTINGTSLNAGTNLLTITGAGTTAIAASAAINSTAGITKTGSGTLTITGAATNTNSIGTGTLSVNGGIVNLITPTGGGPNVLNSTANVAVGGGALLYQFSVSGANQNFANLTINPGESAIFANRSGGFNSAIVFAGTVTRNIGGTITARELDTGREQTVLSSVAQTSLLTSNGTAYATLGDPPSGTTFDNFQNWAAVNANHQLTAAAYTSTTATTLGTAAQNANVVTGVATTTLAAPTTVASFRDSVNQATIIDLNGQTLQTGGILVTSTVATAGSIIKDSVGGGSLTGPAGSDLTLMISANAVTPVPFTISANIVDNVAGGVGTALTKGAPGTLILSGNNTFTNGLYINDGTVQLGSAGALNAATPNAINFGGSGFITGVANTVGGASGGTVANAPTLALAGNSVTVASLASTNDQAGSTPVVENANGASVANATLTINSSTSQTFTGNIQNGTGGGTLGLTLTGTGVQTLTGTNSYTGPTVVNGGTLAVSKTIASSPAISVGSAGTLDVSAVPGGLVIGSGNTLSGSGTVLGTATIGNGANLTPGTLGTAGTLTLGGLTLSSAASTLNFDLNTNGSDMVVVNGTNGLTINGGQFNLSGTATAAAGSTFNLFSYAGTIQGTGVSSLTVASGNTAGLIYTFGNNTTNHFVTLTITGGGAQPNFYAPDANSNYGNPANWNMGVVPNAVGAFAAFGGSGSAALTANRSITVDGAYTVGTLSFNGTNGFGYTLANGGTGTGLTLNNGASAASVTDTTGSHTIASAVQLTANGATFSVSGATNNLTVSGVVSSDATADLGLTKTGSGTLALLGANTYFGGTSLVSGTLQINSASSLGDLSGNLVFGGGTLQLVTDVNSSRNYQVSGANNAIIDTNGHTLALSGTIAPVSGGTGGLVKMGAGTLALSGANTYTGGNNINGGTLNIASDASLGPVPAAAATNVTYDPGTGNTAVLQAAAALTLNANRNIVINSGTGSIDTNGNNVTVNGVISGNGTLQKDGLGTLTIGATTTQAGNTVINAGTLALATGVGVNGTIIMANATTFQPPSGGSANNFIITGANANATFVSSGPSYAINGTITGTADQTLTIGGTTQVSFGENATKEFQTFLGTVEIPTNTTLRISSTNLNNGGDNTTFDVNGFLTTRNNGGVALGALSGSGTVTSGTSGGTNTAVVYTIGAKGISTTFSGVISNGDTVNGKLTAITETGAGTQTLTGANVYTGGTTINAGATLQIGNGGTAGSLAAASAITDNGTLILNRSDATTFANNITGNTGAVVTTGGGTTTLTGTLLVGAINPRAGTTIIDGTAAGSANTVNSNIAPVAGDNATVTVQNNGVYSTNVGNLFVGGLGTGTLNVNGGTVSQNTGLTIGNGATAVGTVNLNTGGTLTTPSINTGGGTSTLNLNGGTLIAAGGANGTFISGLTAARVQAGGAIINNPNTFDPNNPTTIIIAQALVHDPALGGTADGGLSLSGGGMLTLSAANTFTGPTTINAGTLTIMSNGALATGNVTIAAGAALTLATGVTFAHNGATTTTLTLSDTSSVLNLAATTAGTLQDVVGSIVVPGTTYTAAGYYGGPASGVAPAFQIPEFTGNGVIGIGVPAAVPEPSVWALWLAGLGGLGLLAYRRQQRA